MGLLQKAVETYDANLERVGVEFEGKVTLAPVAHLTTSANLVLTLDQDGYLLSAETLDKKAPKVIIPATAASAGRTSGIAPHPLCEQLKYLANYPREKKKEEGCFQSYVDQLSEWTDSEFSHPMLSPILKYVKSGTILKDLEARGLIKLKNTGAPENEKLLVVWRVEGLGQDSGDTWKNPGLFDSFIRFYESASASEANVVTGLDMISGKESVIAEQHPKGVIPLYGNAKLISSNDSNNFTYRGRFITPEQAATVGSISSQKAHNALKWLASNQGVLIGGRDFLCWTPKGFQLPDPFTSYLGISEDTRPSTPSEYREQLSKILNGYKAAIPEGESVLIAAFDAATTGRLALTYFNELDRSDFLDRLGYWDETCNWIDRFGVSSPNLRDIVRFAFGTERESNGSARVEVDDKIMKEHITRLLSCRVDMAHIPTDIMEALFEKAGNPLAYTENRQARNRNRLNFIACAVIRKYKKDRFGEDWKMALEPEKHDLSYQYGRLLAVMEKAERDTFDQDEGREPNAIRLQSVFSRRPQYAAKIIIEALKKSALPRLNPGLRRNFDILTGQIFEQISQYPDSDLNKPLRETYLLGYYLQKNDLYKSRKNSDPSVDEQSTV